MFFIYSIIAAIIILAGVVGFVTFKLVYKAPLLTDYFLYEHDEITGKRK